MVDQHWALDNGVYSLTREIARVRARGYDVKRLNRPHGVAQYQLVQAEVIAA